MVGNMLESYARTMPDDQRREGVEVIVRRLTVLAQVYDSMLGVGLTETVDLADYLRLLCVRLPGLQAERTRPVQIICDGELTLLGLDAVTALGMAIAELVTNTYVHAFPDRDGTVTVTLMRQGVDLATVTVRDDGVGIITNPDSNRHGIGLVKRLLEKIGGTLERLSGDGTIWTLTFPVPASAS